MIHGHVWCKKWHNNLFLIEIKKKKSCICTYSKVDAGDTVHDDEDVSVCQAVKAEIQSS